MESPFTCPECPSSCFRTQALLNKHASRSHGPVEERSCPYCMQVFKDKTSLPRHLKLCRKRPAVAVKCVLPASSVPVRPTAPDTKARSPKKNYSPVERYLASLTAYLNNGGYMHTFVVRRKVLAANTITGYISSVRKFLETIIDGLISGHGSEILEDEENEDKTFEMFILVSIKVQHIAKYIENREKDDFKFRTQKNTLCALKWHIAFLKYLTHPDVVTTGWSSTDCLLRHIATPALKSQVETLARHLDDSHTYIEQHITQLVKPAEQQVKARNSQEALQAKGKWITMAWMGRMAEVIDKEGWARMERLQAILSTTTTTNVLVSITPKSHGQFDWLRDWLIFSFFVDCPPMRPQNGELQIIHTIEPAGSRKTNGVLFFKTRTCLQIINFKNAHTFGEYIAELPKCLEDKLLAYMRVVRPAYAHSLPTTTKKKKARQEEDDTSDESDDGDAVEKEDEESEPICAPTPIDDFRDEVAQWCSQSPFVFLTPGNKEAKKLGARWINFVRENTGQHTDLRVWRKVVETTSSTQNSLDKQQLLSSALLHRHQTGRDYYVTHDPYEKSREVQQVWTTLRASTTAVTSSTTASLATTTTTARATATQHNYSPPPSPYRTPPQPSWSDTPPTPSWSASRAHLPPSAYTAPPPTPSPLRQHFTSHQASYQP